METRMCWCQICGSYSYHSPNVPFRRRHHGPAMQPVGRVGIGWDILRLVANSSSWLGVPKAQAEMGVPWVLRRPPPSTLIAHLHQ